MSKEAMVDDRINVRVGDELKEKLEAICAADPGDPGMGVVVRRLLTYGIEHMERCRLAKRKEVA